MPADTKMPPLVASLRLALLLLAVSAPLLAVPGFAQARAVVELFTSQGCSSCPPADALLTELAERDDIVALAYHVDYWDYAGWADTFGSRAHSERQRAYAASRGSSRIYTPQMIVNGIADVVGSRPGDVHEAIDRAGLPLAVGLDRQEDMLTITVSGQADRADAVVWLVGYLAGARVDIERGENAGRTILYSHVVTGRQMLGMWEGGAGIRLKIPLEGLLAEGNDGLAVLVQHEVKGLPGPVLGAAAIGL